ncbi:uncharacterized protein ACR2FA_011069 isoform 2-T2 [Aphomia sociella]
MEQSSEVPVFVDVQGAAQYIVSEVQHLGSQLSKDQENDTESIDEDSTPSNSKAGESECLLIQTKRVKCPECNRFTTENEEKMLRHIRKVHRGENPFQCYMCDYSTYNKALFEEHVRIHQGIKPFKCSFCPYKSASKKNTKKHELRHRPDNPLKCSKCSFIARHTRSLVSHRTKMNHGTKCADCGYVAIDDKELATHADLHKNNKLFICNKCDAKYHNIKTFQAHKLSRKKCEECDVYVCTKPLLKRHMLTEHKLRIDEDKEYLFVCKICKWGGNSKARILLHLIHHPKQTVDEKVVDIGVLKKLGIMV